MLWHAQIFNLTFYEIGVRKAMRDLRNFCLQVQINRNTHYLFSLILQHQHQGNLKFFPAPFLSLFILIFRES